MKRAPRKYADSDRTQVTPEWLAWRREMIETYWEEFPDHLSAWTDPAVYMPEMYDKEIPEDGCWVIVIEEPYTELRARFRLPPLSMWRARPHMLNDGAVPLHWRVPEIRLHPKRAVIQTPGGDLHLWPHEYMIVHDPVGLISCEGVELHTLGGEPALDEEQLWYVMSRGISHTDAVKLLFAQVGQDFAYITFPAEAVEFFAGVGRPLWRHMQIGRSFDGELVNT